MRYEFHPEAEVDLVETILYYETQALGLGERFAAEVEHAIEQLLKQPKIGAPDESGFRKWVLDTFPYIHVAQRSIAKAALERPSFFPPLRVARL